MKKSSKINQKVNQNHKANPNNLAKNLQQNQIQSNHRATAEAGETILAHLFNHSLILRPKLKKSWKILKKRK